MKKLINHLQSSHGNLKLEDYSQLEDYSGPPIPLNNQLRGGISSIMPVKTENEFDKCEYQCVFCGMKMVSQKSTEYHLASRHAEEAKKRAKIPEVARSCMIRQELHKCGLCDKEVLHDKTFIERHAKSHGYYLKEYYQEHMADK